MAACALMFGVSAGWAYEDVTSTYLKNADLSLDPQTTGSDDAAMISARGWTLLNNWRQDYQKASDDQHVNVVEFYAGWGSLEHTQYAMTQTITLPAGFYRLAVNAFYRQGNDGNGTNEHKAWIFAGEKTMDVKGIRQSELGGFSGSSDLWKASNAFYLGNYSNEFDFNIAEDNTEITLGFKGVFDEPRCWVILGPVKLYEYSAADYLEDYTAKLATAESLLSSDMSAAAKAGLVAAMVDPSTLETATDVYNAVEALKDAIAAANTSIAVYGNYQTAYDNAMTLANELAAAYGLEAYKTQFENKAAAMLAASQVDGMFPTDEVIVYVIDKIGEAVAEANEIAASCASVLSIRVTARTLLDYDIDLPEAKTALQGAITAAAANMQAAESLDDIIAVVNGLNEAVGAYVESVGAVNGGPIDMTFTITNPSFETGDLTGWAVENSSDTGVKPNSNGTYTINNADGDYIFNTWWAGNPISQTVTGLPNGLYKMTALIATDTDHQVQLNANDKFTVVNASPIGKTDGVDGEVYFFVEDGTATISAEGVDAYWYKVDNFRLTCINGSISIPVSEAGYATYCSPYALDFSNIEGLTAYTASMDGTTVAFTPFTSTIAAGNGLLIKGETADVPVVADGNVPENAFVGVLEDTGVEAGVFVLLNGDNGIGFYKTVNNFTVREYSAYLPALASGARFIAIDGEATGIETVKAAEVAETIYNLAGQRVVKAQKGLYIQNGKKHVVK